MRKGRARGRSYREAGSQRSEGPIWSSGAFAREAGGAGGKRGRLLDAEKGFGRNEDRRSRSTVGGRGGWGHDGAWRSAGGGQGGLNRWKMHASLKEGHRDWHGLSLSRPLAIPHLCVRAEAQHRRCPQSGLDDSLSLSALEACQPPRALS